MSLEIQKINEDPEFGFSPLVIFNIDSLNMLNMSVDSIDFSEYVKSLPEESFGGFRDLPPEKLFDFKKIYGLFDAFFEKIKGMIDLKKFFELESEGILQNKKIPTREEKVQEYQECGKWGEQQFDVEGKQRLIIYNCQERRWCPRCHELYHRGLAVRNLKVIQGILQSKAGSWLSMICFTLPDWLTEKIVECDVIRQRQIRQKLFGISRQVLAEFFKPDDGLWGGYQVFHGWSSENPFKARWHIHSGILGVYLRGDFSCPGVRKNKEQREVILTEMRKRVKICLFKKGMADQKKPTGFAQEDIVGEELRKRWKEVLRGNFSEFYRQAPEDDEGKEYDVKYLYAKRADEEKLVKEIFYAFRSFWKDIFELIRFSDEGIKYAFESLVEVVKSYTEKEGENFRYFGYLAKGVRFKYLPVFGLRLNKEKFEVADSVRFCVFNRTKEKISVVFFNKEGEVSCAGDIGRDSVQDEKFCLSGQVWERAP